MPHSLPVAILCTQPGRKKTEYIWIKRYHVYKDIIALQTCNKDLKLQLLENHLYKSATTWQNQQSECAPSEDSD